MLIWRKHNLAEIGTIYEEVWSTVPIDWLVCLPGRGYRTVRYLPLLINILDAETWMVFGWFGCGIPGATSPGAVTGQVGEFNQKTFLICDFFCSRIERATREQHFVLFDPDQLSFFENRPLKLVFCGHRYQHLGFLGGNFLVFKAINSLPSP